MDVSLRNTLAVFIYIFFYSLLGKSDIKCLTKEEFVVSKASRSFQLYQDQRVPSSLSSLHKRAKLWMILLQSCAPSGAECLELSDLIITEHPFICSLGGLFEICHSSLNKHHFSVRPLQT